MDLRGEAALGSTDLRIVAGYSPEAFTRLLRDGIPRDGRELGMMKRAAQARLQYLTDAESSNLYAYLRTLSVRN